MKQYFGLFSLILFFLWEFTANAQGPVIEKLGRERGLSNTNVVSFTQDRDGFIWVATKDGLNRFDSNSFKVFKRSENDQNSVCSNMLNFVFADPVDDVVWIASEKRGVDAYNYRSNVFTHYEHDYSNPETNDLSANGITHIDADENGNLWFATYDGGVDFLDRKTGHFTNYNQSNVPGLGSNLNWCVLYDSSERIYVGHVNDGFSIVNSRTKTAVNFKHNPADPSSLPDNTVTAIFKDSRERIWIGTRNGLTLFFPESEKMLTFKNDPANEFSLSGNFIQKTIETTDHQLYVGIEGGGLNILDLKNLDFEPGPQEVKFKRIPASETPEGLSSLSVQAVFQDSYGNIWIGGLGGEINFISARENLFKKITHLPIIGNTNSLNNRMVLNVCVDNNDNVWVANGVGGISIYRQGVKTAQLSDFGEIGIQTFITCVFKGSGNTIWAGTGQGNILKIDANTRTYKKIDGFPNLKNLPTYSIFEDSKNVLWIATDVGVHRYNTRTGECTVFTTSNSQLPDNVIRTIAEDARGNIWVGTLIGGLCVFDEDFKLVENYGQRYDFYALNQIYRDSKNRMWIGSQNDLFLIKDQPQDSVVRMSTVSGLTETNIRAIIEGKTDNEIWISTTNGLSHIDLNTMHVSNFDDSDGIVEGDYLNGSVAKTSSGLIYFGSQNGISWFDQNAEQRPEQVPQAAITRFSVANNRDNLNRFSDIAFSQKVVLKPFQNSFQISFNVLDYSLAPKVGFVYQMAGLDDAWYMVGNGNVVTFRNLKPGNYSFRLRTSLENPELLGQITSLNIHIEPPLWLTWWMRLLYVLLIVAAAIYALRFYKNKLKIENDLLLEKKSRQQEQDLNEEKLRFFTNITHELRSPMTLILGPLEDLISENSFRPAQKQKLLLIQRIANRLLQSINQILEFRKSENKSRKLSVIKDDLTSFLYEIGTKFKDLNQNKDIDFGMDIPKQKVEMFFDPDVITIIMDNLLSNAFKYTVAGRIKLALRFVNEESIEYTEITVSDTGYGISESDLPRVFERYYQARHATHPVKGTGIGLALVKNMVELHEAEISVDSRVNEGTTFTLRFLTNNSYPDALHYLPEEAQIEENQENSKNVILVVDDDHEIVDYIAESLSDTYTVLSAENGKKGYETAAAEIPDIIVSDIMMPIMDGVEMCAQVKQDVRTSHIPVILLTARDSAHDQKRGYDAGADSYLTKPFSSNLLKSRLKNIFDGRKKLSLSSSSKFKQKQQLLNNSIGELDREFLRQLTSVIEENLEDEEMNISYVAAQMNMSHSTLYRKIKALTNLTANEFIRKVRINYAEQLLITGQYNISEIMYQVGINSSSYFRQCFKDEFGMNPSEYLQKLKEV